MAEKRKSVSYPVFGSIAPYHPSLGDRFGSLVYDAAKAFGFPFPQRMREEALFAADFTPFVATAIGADDSIRQLKAGNYGRAAADAALGAAASVPIAGGILKKGGKQALRKIETWYARPGNIDPPGRSPLKTTPSLPQRPFEADYPVHPDADEAGRLRYDIEGRPLVAPIIAGRNKIGQPDRVLTEKEFRAFARLAKIPIKKVSPEILGRNVGMYRYVPHSNEPYDILIANDLQDELPNVLGHEVGHAIDQLSGFIPTLGLADEFRNIYRATASRSPLFGRSGNGGGPEDYGYWGRDLHPELMAEAIRAYMTNPNWLKTNAPKVAARIRKYVNEDPQLRKIIQFNALGGAALGTGMISEQMGSERERGDM